MVPSPLTRWELRWGEVLFYDDLSSPKGVFFGPRNQACVTNLQDPNCHGAMVGVKTDQYGSTYFYRFDSSWYSTGIMRSLGWRRWQFKTTGGGTEVYLDGQRMGNVHTSLTNVGQLLIGGTWGLGSTSKWDNAANYPIP